MAAEISELVKIEVALRDMRVGGFDPKDGEDALGYAESLLEDVRRLVRVLEDALAVLETQAENGSLIAACIAKNARAAIARAATSPTTGEGQ